MNCPRISTAHQPPLRNEERDHDPTSERDIHHLPQAPVYARVDGLIAQDGSFLVNEVELIEPALYSQLEPTFIAQLCSSIR